MPDAEPTTASAARASTSTGDAVSETARRTRFEPPMSTAGAPFWAATREQRLVLPWCVSCHRPHWFPREVCPHCWRPGIEWRPSDGLGTVYAASTMPKPAMPMLADRVPYVVALVELDDGVRMMTNIVGMDPDSVTVGRAVQVGWEALSDGRHLPVFTSRT